MTNHVPLAALACLHAAVATAQVVLPPNLGLPATVQTVPGPAHDAALAALAAGGYRTALELAGQEYEGAVRAGQQRWIDSIAAAALAGECLFEAGGLRDAVARYEESMLLAASNADWLLSVQFPARPPQPLQRAPASPWGRSARGVPCAVVPDTMTIRQGGADPEDVLKRGGLLVAPHDRTVRPQEIMRMLVVAIYRHGHLLGELARDNHALATVARALARRPAPPNHWSQAWIDVAQGTANWAQGRPDVAEQLLRRGLLLGNQLDHALTPWALIVLGRIALDANQAAPAAKLFEEATYVAATYGDARALEEAFALACAAQAAAGGRPPTAMLRAAADWAQPALPALRARLLALLAEAEVRAEDPRRAEDALRAIDERLLRGEAGQGTLGAQAAYAAALACYAGGDVPGGDADLARGMAVAASRAPRLFQTVRLVDLLRAGASDVPDREADALFGRLLADPSARDVATDPLGTLAVSATDRTEAFETWVALAQRRGEEPALLAAEAATRGRWLGAQPLGGRRLAVERWLAADPRTLAPADAARRATLLAGQRELGDTVDRMARLQGALGAALAAGAADAGLPGPPAEWNNYAVLAERRTQLVAALAAGREPVPWEFPPLLPTAEIRRRLRPRQLLLSFHWSRGGLFAALESRDRAAVWQVRQAAGIQRELEALARSLGLFEAAGPVATDRLAEGDWPGSAARLERMLFENSRVTLAEGIDELVVVPDGWLWYLPFEILPVASQRADAVGARPLGEVCRVRYSPTRSLAVARFEPPAGGAVGLHVGRMSRAEKPASAPETAAHLAAAVEGLRPLDLPAGAPPLPVVAATLGALVVFDELGASGPAAERTLVPAAPGRGRTTFADWLQPPLKRPRLVVLAGLQTAMDAGLAAVPPRPGDDVFMAVTDLLAAGARTALVSRWRMGGRTSTDLVTEFLRTAVAPAADGTAADAATAWRRAIDVVVREAPDPDREPRVRFVAGAPLADATHPLFWAGYLLVDGGTGRDEAIVAAAPAPGRAAP